MGILTVDYSERVKKIEEENAVLKDKLKRRNCQIADLKNKVKEGKKTITTCELVLSEFVSREEFERIKREVIYK